MNRIWFAIITAIFLVIVNIVNYAIEKSFGSTALLTARSLEYIFFGVVFYFRAIDANLDKKGHIGGYLSLLLAVFAPIFLWVTILSGLYYKSKPHKNNINESDFIKKQSVQMINETIESLYEKIKCEDILKVKIVILTIYLKIASALGLNDEEEKIMDEIANDILDNDEKTYNELMEYTEIYTQNELEMINSNKDESQKLFFLAKKHAKYLFNDKKEDELLAETMLLIPHYNLMLTVAKLIKIK